ncbi:MAG: lipoyl(octanoyl) transferase LipB [Burkholderiaceae bacterium]|nr:lipoyl(octanoyl) transferase LipB [Burkholderiaceae bacterium]
MRSFTASRGANTADEIWVVEHPPVFTLGRAASLDHVRAPGGIAVVRTERGGQVTYHGPGQVVCYVLLDLRRAGIRVRDFVDRIEAATISLLGEYGIDAVRRAGAPGVYVRRNGSVAREPAGAAGETAAVSRETAPAAGEVAVAGAKIASIGVRITDGCSWHGVALNVAMDLEPFTRIDPCGYPGLAVTDMRSCLSSPPDFDMVAGRFATRLASVFVCDAAPLGAVR